MSKSTQREQVISQLVARLSADISESVELIDQDELAVVRSESGDIYLFTFTDDGQYHQVTMATVSESSSGAPAGGGSYEVATESPATGSNATFTFTGPPTLVFRNGVMEQSLGSVVGDTFVFNAAPNLNDVIEGLV